MQEPSGNNNPVEQALKDIHDPKELGESPLAAPYLLGNVVADIADFTAEERGKALQKIIIEQINLCSDGDDISAKHILTKRYLDKSRIVKICKELGIGSATFHRYRHEAISELAARLIGEFKPAIRLEKPPSSPQKFYDYSDQAAQCVSALQKNRAVWITGPSGIGKSALMGSVARSYAPHATFWMTITPGINDHIQYLTFALGYFLSQQGYPALWQEGIASSDFTASESGRGKFVDMVREALSNLSENETQVLFCFDDVDRLQRTQNANHEVLVRIIESFGSMTPMLLAGQKAITDADEFCELSGISESSMTRWLQASSLELSDDPYGKLYRYTQGNPRLVELAIMSLRRGESADSLLEHMHQNPGIHFLLERLMQRLSVIERAILIQLSVFRIGAPADAWRLSIAQVSEETTIKEVKEVEESDIISAISALQSLQLVESHSPGSIQLHPIYRDAIYRRLGAEKLRQLHKWAAQVWEERSAFTPALYHHIQCGEPEAAIMLWDANHHQEISQGQANAAYQHLKQIDMNQLSANAKCQLALHLANLEQLLGNLEGASHTLEKIIENTPLIFAIQAGIALGKIANELGDFPKAQRYFEQAIRQSESLIGLHLAHAHKGLSWLHVRDRTLGQAHDEALRARYEVENVLGYIQETNHNYHEAATSYQQALDAAEEIGDERGIANSCANLAGVYTWLGDYDLALQYQNSAERSYQLIGDRLAIPAVKINCGLLFNQMGKHQKALDTLTDAQDEGAKLPGGLPSWPQALIAQGMAESYLGLNQLAEAEESARQVIELEEEGVSADAYRTLGEVMATKGDFASAENFICTSIEYLQRAEEPDLYLLGFGQRALAKVFAAQELCDKAKEAQAKAIDYFQTINLEHEVQHTRQILMNCT